MSDFIIPLGQSVSTQRILHLTNISRMYMYFYILCLLYDSAAQDVVSTTTMKVDFVPVTTQPGTIPDIYRSPKATRILKIGLIVTETKQSDIGFSTTGGAIPLALQQIREEHILDDYEFEWYLNYTVCDEKTAIGAGIRLITNVHVDVIIGPPCTSSIEAVAMLGAYFECLQVAWGYAFSVQLSDVSRFPFLSVISANSLQIGYALSEVLTLYDWSNVAIIYQDDSINYCQDVISDVNSALSDPTVEHSTNVVTIQRLKASPTNAEIDLALARIRTRSRIVVMCFPDAMSKRNILIHIYQQNMSTSEYVFLLVDFKGYGIGQSAVTTSENSNNTVDGGFTGIWVDTVNNNTDGMNEIAKKAAHRLFVIDILNAGNSKIDPAVMRKEVFERVRDYPFYCKTDACLTNERYPGIGGFTSHLYDSFMLYATVMNKTVDTYKNISTNFTDEYITVRNSVTFDGMSGRVVMTENGTREPHFFMTGLNANGDSQIFVNLTYTHDQNYMTVVPNYENENTTIWAGYGGKRPPSIPPCGFDGLSCPKAMWDMYGGYYVGAAVTLILFTVLCILVAAYFLRLKRQEQQRLDSEWRISRNWLVKPLGSRVEDKSAHSLQTARTGLSGGSKSTFGSWVETNDFDCYMFQGEPILARKHKPRIRYTMVEIRVFRALRKLEHDNIHRFIGMSIDAAPVYSVWKFASRGSLSMIIANSPITMDGFFMFSLIRDMAEGMCYLHEKSGLPCHGYLTSSTCLIDDRWQLKITGYGLQCMTELEQLTKKEMLYHPPERLENPSDVSKASEVLYNVKQRTLPPYRPELDTKDEVEVHSTLLYLIRDCWSEAPAARPDFKQIQAALKTIATARKQNLMDHVFNIMESYAETLEKEVEMRTSELQEEKKKSDTLLYRMLPPQVADRLKTGQAVEPESFNCVSIFFSDVVRFTDLAARSTPLQIVNILNDLYSTFDTIIEQHGVYKVETIGDAYLCASGLPRRNGNLHIKNICEMSLGFLQTIQSFRIAHLPTERVNIRIGVHSGPCVAGVVGLSMPRYCLFGDTVNTASRMESNGKPGQIHMSSEARRLLMDLGGYETELRGEIMVKGKGAMTTYWLLGRVGEVVQCLDGEDDRVIELCNNEDYPPQSHYSRASTLRIPPRQSTELEGRNSTQGCYQEHYSRSRRTSFTSSIP